MDAKLDTVVHVKEAHKVIRDMRLDCSTKDFSCRGGMKKHGFDADKTLLSYMVTLLRNIYQQQA